jgi:two-component system sensor histidine kinase MprB
MVQGVPDDLMRAIANLLDNAVKWSPPGSPIDVSVADGKVSVRDRGPGVAPEDRLHVFDRFYRAASARTLPGSGLGLAIVRQVAEAHGGNADVQAAAGGGSVFTLHLPVGSEEASTASGRVAPTRPTPVPPSFSL